MVEQRQRIEIRPGVFRSLIHTEKLMLAIVDFENGPWPEPEPYHSHPHEQLSYVAFGEVVFYCEGQTERFLKQGDTFGVSSGVKHTVKVVTPQARIVDCFTPIRQEFLGPASTTGIRRSL